jgi:hypothetical protein
MQRPRDRRGHVRRQVTRCTVAPRATARWRPMEPWAPVAPNTVHKSSNGPTTGSERVQRTGDGSLPAVLVGRQGAAW